MSAARVSALKVLGYQAGLVVASKSAINNQ
jgi:hypothetical protein